MNDILIIIIKIYKKKPKFNRNSFFLFFFNRLCWRRRPAFCIAISFTNANTIPRTSGSRYFHLAFGVLRCYCKQAKEDPTIREGGYVIV